MTARLDGDRFSPDALLADLDEIMSLGDLDAARRFPERQRAFQLITQLANVPGRVLPDLATVRERLASADRALFDRIAQGIRSGRLRGDRLRRLLDRYAANPDNGRVMRRDLADRLWAGVCGHDSVSITPRALSPDMVHLEHTPVSIVLSLVDQWPQDHTNLGLLDVGCGLGQVTHLVAALTGMPVRGIDIEPAYVAQGRAAAKRLGLANVSLDAMDARRAAYDRGEVVYMFSPFTGALLGQVLDRIRQHSEGRRVYIASYGATSAVLAAQDWLDPAGKAPVDPFALCMFGTHTKGTEREEGSARS